MPQGRTRPGFGARLGATALASGLAGLGLGLVACAPLPEVQAVNYAVDDDELRERVFIERVDQAAKLLSEDPALHLQLEGHADEDNTDAYNEALSRRRAEALRDRIVARYPELAPRVRAIGRGEWDPAVRGEGDEVKAQNRRVVFRFYYPRACDVQWSGEFLDCMVGRLDPPPAQPDPPPAAPPPPLVAEAEPETVDEDAGYRGLYGFLGAGWSVSTFERVRQHVPITAMVGYVWAPSRILRISAGGEVEHNIELGPLFGDAANCTGACQQRVEALRVLPEFRVGAAQGRLWAHLKFFAGPVFVIRPALTVTEPDGLGGERDVNYARRSQTGVNLGVGPGFTIRLGRRLAMSFDFDVSFDGRLEGGVGIYGGKLSFGAFARAPRGPSAGER